MSRFGNVCCNLKLGNPAGGIVNPDRRGKFLRQFYRYNASRRILGQLFKIIYRNFHKRFCLFFAFLPFLFFLAL